MQKDELVNELRPIIENYLKEVGKELVDLIYRYEGRDLFLKILADNLEGGITLEECAKLNNEIGKILEERNILEQSYILEVSSPGLDRPLKTKNDFSRCIDRKVKFFLKEPINGKIEWDATINKVEEDSIYVEIDGQISEFPLSKINKAKQII